MQGAANLKPPVYKKGCFHPLIQVFHPGRLLMILSGGETRKMVRKRAAAVGSQGPEGSGVAPHLKTGGLRLRRALVEVGHGLPVEVHPGVEVGTGGLLRSRTCCLAWKTGRETKVTQAGWIRAAHSGSPTLTPGFVVFRSVALGLVLLTCWQRERALHNLQGGVAS